jgi:hypothetical protein
VSKVYRGILIDPKTQTVAYVEGPMTLEDLHGYVEDYIDTAFPFGRYEPFFVGDHSALKDPPLPCYFIPGYPWPLYGRTIILGATGNGETRSTKLTIEEIASVIVFAGKRH